MSDAAKKRVQDVTGIPLTQWAQDLGQAGADEVAAMERKLGQRLEEWLNDYGTDYKAAAAAPGPSGQLTADNTSVTADATDISADATEIAE